MFRVSTYASSHKSAFTNFIVGCLIYLIGGFPTLVYALPQGGTISSGTGTIDSNGSSLTVTQTTNKIVINWESFSVGQNESVIFLQPDKASSALNNILGNSRTVVEGNLSANGRIVLSNPNGIYISPTANINVASLIASTLKISEQDFIDGLYKFSQDPNKPLASILNEGTIRASDFAALIAPSVNNKGVVVANLGTVGIASGEVTTIDFVGDNLIKFTISKPVEGQVLDKDGNLIRDRITNSGSLQADGGQVILTAKNASDIIKNVINVEGVIEAKTVTRKNGRIFLGGGDQGNVNVAGTLDTSGEKPGDQGGEITVAGASVTVDKGSIQAKGNDAKGGEVTIIGTDFVSAGGKMDVSGKTGGNINVTTGGLSIAAPILAQGDTGQGGNITITSLFKSWENIDALLDVSGASGGVIKHFSEQQITTSGKYLALGTEGKGGSIDVTAPTLKVLSATIDASGTMAGGQIRLGGEYQGGKNLANDEIPNAHTLIINDSTKMTAKTMGTNGAGGRIIAWADKQAAVFGQFDVTPGINSGVGGFVEVSSGNMLTFGAKVSTGIDDRRGTLLLDPKNITIATSAGGGAYTLNAIIGEGYSGNSGKDYNQSLDSSDSFGFATSLDGTRLAVGAQKGDSSDSSRSSSGEVYLYTFTDSAFSGAALAGIIGHGYSGDKNINQSLDSNDRFGFSVSLDGNRLAVGAQYDDGNGGSSDSGAVYLYAF
jgi:filamentous hemagglutinin family protein